MRGERGQALPLALVALAIGTLLIVPFLSHASTSLIGSRNFGRAITEQYSADAGVEWALWKLTNDPALTTSTEYTAEPLQPMPSEINDSSFPVTKIRFVEDAEATETITPEWQTGPGWMSYPLTAGAESIITVIIETNAPKIKIRLQEEEGQYHFNSSPCTAEFEIDDPGLYHVKVQTLDHDENGEEIPYSGPGTISITYPIASYDIRSWKNKCAITARVVASEKAVKVISWQIE